MLLRQLKRRHARCLAGRRAVACQQQLPVPLSSREEITRQPLLLLLLLLLVCITGSHMSYVRGLLPALLLHLLYLFQHERWQPWWSPHCSFAGDWVCNRCFSGWQRPLQLCYWLIRGSVMLLHCQLNSGCNRRCGFVNPCLLLLRLVWMHIILPLLFPPLLPACQRGATGSNNSCSDCIQPGICWLLLLHNAAHPDYADLVCCS